MSKTGNIINGILGGDSGVTALVSNRIYPVAAPPTVDNDLLVYSIDGEDLGQTKDGNAGSVHTNLTVSAWSSNYDTAHTIKNAVVNALDNYEGTQDSSTVEYVALKEKLDGPFDEARQRYSVDLRFFMIYK